MHNTVSTLIALGFCILSCAGLTASAQDRVIVSGYTYAVTKKDNYSPIPNVKVQAFNNVGPLGAAATSEADGRFKLEVPAGEPIRLIFRGRLEDEQFIPEIKQLAGKAGTENVIHVALYTGKEYIAAMGAEQLNAKLKFSLSVLTAKQSDDAELIREMIRKFPE